MPMMANPTSEEQFSARLRTGDLREEWERLGALVPTATKELGAGTVVLKQTRSALGDFRDLVRQFSSSCLSEIDPSNPFVEIKRQRLLADAPMIVFLFQADHGDAFPKLIEAVETLLAERKSSLGRA